MTIDLQKKTQTKNGTIETYWFENEHLGLKKTLFHKITIPLNPFNSGFEYESQPLETCLLIDWLDLNLTNPSDLHGMIITSNKYPSVEGSIYVGNVHNPFDILQLSFQKTDEKSYKIKGLISIDFEHEMTANKESFSFQTTISF
ncbi:hypothetical protein KFE94_11900 [bacterium SCSIO 12643]|nr:hypothetical protein KFE94_11900 [bacterium SCSIO 12643]